MTSSTSRKVLTRPAVKVRQPLGDFFAFSVRADVLNRLTYSLPAEVRERLEREAGENKGGYSIFGSQRAEKKTRLQEIASFIRTTDAAFPNAIILAANYAPDGLYLEDENARWIVEDHGNDFWRVSIPLEGTPCAQSLTGNIGCMRLITCQKMLQSVQWSCCALYILSCRHRTTPMYLPR
jgi:hypothetical protein